MHSPLKLEPLLSELAVDNFQLLLQLLPLVFELFVRALRLLSEVRDLGHERAQPKVGRRGGKAG